MVEHIITMQANNDPVPCHIEYADDNCHADEINIYIGCVMLGPLNQADRMDISYFYMDRELTIDIKHDYKIVTIYCHAGCVVNIDLFRKSVREIHANNHVQLVGHSYPELLETLSTYCISNPSVRSFDNLVFPNLKKLHLTHDSESDISDCEFPKLKTLICRGVNYDLPISLENLSCEYISHYGPNSNVLENLKKFSCENEIKLEEIKSLKSLEFMRLIPNSQFFCGGNILRDVCPNLKKLAIGDFTGISREEMGLDIAKIRSSSDIFELSNGFPTLIEFAPQIYDINFNYIPKTVTDLFISHGVNLDNFDPMLFPNLEKLHCSMEDIAIMDRIARSSVKSLVLNIDMKLSFWSDPQQASIFVDKVKHLDVLSLPCLTYILYDKFMETKTSIHTLFLLFHSYGNISLLPFDVVIMTHRYASMYVDGTNFKDNCDHQKFHASKQFAVLAGSECINDNCHENDNDDDNVEHLPKVKYPGHDSSYDFVSRARIPNAFGTLTDVVYIRVPDEFIHSRCAKSARK